VRLEGLGQLKKIHFIWTRTHEFPAFSILSQPITPPRAPYRMSELIFLNLSIILAQKFWFAICYDNGKGSDHIAGKKAGPAFQITFKGE
jgi:hypothetical protein